MWAWLAHHCFICIPAFGNQHLGQSPGELRCLVPCVCVCASVCVYSCTVIDNASQWQSDTLFRLSFYYCAECTTHHSSDVWSFMFSISSSQIETFFSNSFLILYSQAFVKFIVFNFSDVVLTWQWHTKNSISNKIAYVYLQYVSYWNCSFQIDSKCSDGPHGVPNAAANVILGRCGNEGEKEDKNMLKPEKKRIFFRRTISKGDPAPDWGQIKHCRWHNIASIP